MKMLEIKIYFAKTEKTERIIDDLETYLNYTFGGYTAYNGFGGYIGDILTEYKEDSYIYEILTTKTQIDYKSHIKELFTGSGEECIMITQKCINEIDYISL